MKILLADDHTLIRENLSEFLQRLEPEVNVIEAASLPEAEKVANEQSPLDLIILDLMMPGMDGLEGLKKMMERFPTVPVTVLSGSIDRKIIRQTLELGAKGFIPKTIGSESMLSALRLILSGETYIPPIALADDGTEGVSGTAESDADIVAEGPLSALTDREKDVLSLLTKGLPNKSIARELDLKEVTVKVHLQGIFRKLQVSNRAQAVATALGLGWKN